MLRLQGVDFSYPGSAEPAIRGLSAEIYPGTVTVVMGANGSGKSTLARLISGLEMPDKGSVQIDAGTNLVGLVRQDPRNQIIAALVEEEVAFGPENLGLSPDEIRRRITAALEAVGLDHHENRAPDSLSAGQQQRLAIAGVLAMEPEYLVFDEASSMLDPAGREDFYRLCRSLAQGGHGVISITHFPDEALRADTLIVLRQGTIGDTGSPQSVFARNPDLAAPFVLRLTEALRKNGIELSPAPVEIADLAAALAGYVPENTGAAP